MAIGIVWVGITLDAEDDLVHIHRTLRLGILKPKRANDGSYFKSRFPITCNDEAVNLSEYTHRLVDGSSTFCLFLEQWERDYPDDFRRCPFHELVLTMRFGLEKLTHIVSVDCIRKIHAFIVDRKKELNYHVF